jgi:Sortase domain
VLAILRRWERLAWIAATLVVVATGAFAVRAVAAGFGQAQETARFHAAAAAPSTGEPCIMAGCTRPMLVGSPTRVRIPAIDVDTGLEDLTLNPNGQLNPPETYDQAGWYSAGVIPGDPGPAVIAGHVDSVSGPAVFYRLHQLAAGDIITVLRGGVWVTFRVINVEQYAKDQFPAERVYRPTPDAELRLITCGGDFNPGRLSYQDNIVVYAVIE